MTLPPDFDQPPLRGLQRLDRAIDRGQARIFRILWVRVPPHSVAWNLEFQQLLASRFLADIALQALLYGSLIATARGGGGAVEAALLGTAYLLPGVLLGLYGGAVADALPKRVALAGAYLLMGAIALLLPRLFGTDFGALLAVLFAVRALHQVSQPSEASAVPLVATPAELASATSFLGLASSTGEVVGKALIAPIVVRTYGINPVTVLAGVLFLLSATRVVDLRPQQRVDTHADAESPHIISTAAVVRWLFEVRAVLWMLLLAALVSTVNVVLGVLGPQYVSEVLGVDPANALYVFAPAPIGLLTALAIAPMAMRRLTERSIAAAGFIIVAAAMSALGAIGPVTEAFGWLLVVDIPGVPKRVEMAGTLSVFLGFGMTLAAAATQTYLSRFVPLNVQGRAFAMLGVMKDGLAIAPLLVLGAVAEVVGVAQVLSLAPAVLLALALGIDWLAGRWRGPGTPRVR